MSERDDITALKEAVLRLEALWRDLDKRLTAIENIKTMDIVADSEHYLVRALRRG